MTSYGVSYPFAVYERYMNLEVPAENGIQLEYIWIGGSGHDLRCKTKTWFKGEPKSADELPIWNFDGSSTGQAPGHDSEVLIKPVAIYPDPFRGASARCAARPSGPTGRDGKGREGGSQAACQATRQAATGVGSEAGCH